MRSRALAALLFAAAGAAVGCAARTQPYRFSSPMLGHADVPAETLPGQTDGAWSDAGRRGGQRTGGRGGRSGRSNAGRPRVAYGWQTDAQAGIRTVSARGIEVTMPTASAEAATAVSREGYAREVVWSRLPAPHTSPDVTLTRVREPTDLRALVGQRDKRDPFVMVIDWLGELGIPFDTKGAGDGPALVAWANGAGKLHAPTEAVSPGDIIVFDRARSDSSADLVALVIARDARGVLEFMYAGNGVIRRGFVDPTRPTTRRDLEGKIVNTFMRHGKQWPPKGTRYLAGELAANVIRTR